MKNIAIIGLGEIGSSLYEVYKSKGITPQTRDVDGSITGDIDILDIGTTKKINGNCVHSPVRGVHPNLKQGIETFYKFIGHNDYSLGEQVAKHYTSLGINYSLWPDSKSTELAKLLSTTYCLAW